MAVATTTALAIAAVAMTAAGTAVAVNSQLEQAAAQEKASKFNEAVAENNALSARYQAQAEARAIRQRNARLVGKQRAAFAKAGVMLSGSVQDVILDSAVEGERERLAVLYSGTTQSNYYKSQAKLFKFEGETAKGQVGMQVAGTVLGGLSSAASYGARIPTTRSASTAPSFSGRSGGGLFSPSYNRTVIPSTYD